MRSVQKKYLFLVVAISLLFLGWGKDGHIIINRGASYSFNNQMSYFYSWVDSITAHASDADYRKSSVPGEDIKHYIDIDNYPEFLVNGYITQNLDSLKMQHGTWFVEDQGVLPWAILWTLDSIKASFVRRDFHKAMLHSADLGHYVGDACMPLHITKNYNGQLTNQYGVHSRFESSMISRYKGEIIFGGDSIEYISDKTGFVFNLIYGNYKYVDSLLRADSLAKAVTGSNSSTAYYAAMWSYSKPFTIGLFKRASNVLANLIYSIWVDSGRPEPTTELAENDLISGGFELGQNFPNPFNPVTRIRYSLGEKGNVVLRVFDQLGREVSTLVNGEREAGEHITEFHGNELPSGIYYYRIESGAKSEVRKMLLLK